MRELREKYKIHIKIGDRVQTFSTNNFVRENGRIKFVDRLGQPKDFSDSPEVLVGIEEMAGERK